MQLFLHDSSWKGTLYSTPLYSSQCLSQLCTGPTWATRSSAHAICEDSRSNVWKESGTTEKNHELFLGWEGGKEVVGWRIREARRARLLLTERRSAGSSAIASVFCASLSSCLSSQSSFWFILWWSSSCCVCMLNWCFWCDSHVFETPLHAYVEKGWAGVFQLVYGWCLFSAWGIRLGMGSVSLFFTGGGCVCVVCVWVRTRTHIACGVLRCEPGCRGETPGEPGRNPDVM